MPGGIFRIITVFLISFFAYKFLDIIFDLVRSYIKIKARPADNIKDKKDPEVIETEFINGDDGEEK
ncbi:MAG: hypothetical protein FWH10_03095 [Oscillospiraceae bacterium]|nr:hypothetical protein [Oscillospiraceae bacterium]